MSITVRSYYVPLFMALAVGASGCTDNGETTTHKTQVTVVLSGTSCAGIGPVNVYINGPTAGTISPGGSVTKEVEAGNVTVAATSQSGTYNWATAVINEQMIGGSLAL